MTPDETGPGDYGGPVYGVFANHAIVRLRCNGRETWYDPSFALGPFQSLEEYETQLLGKGTENPGGFCAVVGYRTITNPRGQNQFGGYLSGAMPAPTGLNLEAHDPPRKQR